MSGVEAREPTGGVAEEQEQEQEQNRSRTGAGEPVAAATEELCALLSCRITTAFQYVALKAEQELCPVREEPIWEVRVCAHTRD